MEIGHSAGWVVALAAFAGGLISFFSPCVAPLVPGYIGYLSGATLSRDGDGSTQARAATWRQSPALAASALFIAGFSAP